MKYLTIFFLFISLSNSCKYTSKKQDLSNQHKVDSIAHTNIYIDIPSANDTIDINKFLIKNNKIFLPKKLFKSIWKNPDSTKIIVPDCGYLTEVNSIIKEYYFKGAKFLTYDDYTELVSIDFSKTNFELYYPKITFSSKTKITTLKDIFPNSYTLREKNNSEKNVRIRLSFGKDINQYIILDFENESLIYLEIWSPC